MVISRTTEYLFCMTLALRRACLPLALALLPGAAGGQATVEPCPSLEPRGYELELARVEASSIDGIEDARAHARQRMEERFCAGRTELCCASVKRHIESWGTGEWMPGHMRQPGSACAAVVIPDTFLEALPSQCEAFRKDLDQIARDLTTRVGDRILSLEPPTWESGCVAGELGAAVAGEIRSLLKGSHEAETPTERDDAIRVLTRLSPGVGGVRAVVYARPPGTTMENLGSLVFPTALFDIPANEVGQCRPDQDLSLDDGARVAPSGLTVEIRIPTRDGLACDQETLEATVRVSRPARVQVFNVAHTGESFLVWPPPGQRGIVQDTASLGSYRMTWNANLGDERLVAVAVPLDAPVTRTEGWIAYCRVPGPFDGTSYPEGAAVGTATYQVLRGDGRRCPLTASRPPEDPNTYATACGGP